MAGGVNILVLSDNDTVCNLARPIFAKRKCHHFTITNSHDIDPRLDHKHIIDTYELVLSLHCKKIFPPVLVNNVTCINIHPGYSPYNRGMFPHVFSMVNGMSAGVTIHEMDETIDLGPWIYRVEVKILDSDTSESLYKRIIDVELELLDYCLDDLIKGNYVKFEHEEKGNYNSMQDYKELCNLNRFEHGDTLTILRALSHNGHWNAHIGNTYFSLHTHTKNEDNHTHTHTHTG